MIVVAFLLGYLLGGLPTADWIASTQGIDLRSSGSGNPGANNARRVGGVRLGLLVLGAEVVKGVVIVAVAAQSTDEAAVAAGVGAVAGNVWNPYRRLAGGQGLGISLGVLVVGWPLVVPGVVAVLGAIAVVVRRVPAAAIASLAVLLAAGFSWAGRRWPSAWGVEASLLPWLSVGLAAVLLPKQLRNLRADRRGGHRSDPTS